MELGIAKKCTAHAIYRTYRENGYKMRDLKAPKPQRVKAFYQLDHHEEWLRERSDGWIIKNLDQRCRLIANEGLFRKNKEGLPYKYRNGRPVRLKITPQTLSRWY